MINILELRKYIALLSVLTRAPALPNISAICPTVTHVATASAPVTEPSSNHAKPTESCSLSFDDEKQLLEAFTFIASITTDPLKVSALCIEEHVASEKIEHIEFTLKIAANNGDLTEVQNGLRNLIAELNTVTAKASSKAYADVRIDNISQCIIKMNYNRILCRLKSRHAQYAKGRSHKNSLQQQVVKLYGEHEHHTTASVHLMERMESAKTLLATLEAGPQILAATPTNSRVQLLLELVTLLHNLWCDSEFQNVFKNEKITLLTVAKLARYRSAAIFFIKQFHAHPGLCAMKVESVKLNSAILPAYMPTPGALQSFLSDVRPGVKDNRELLRRTQKFHQQITNSRIRSTPDQAFAHVLNSRCSVHAEIQLLFHYELYQELPPPRIILSTKKPCWLCSVFFNLHGRYYVPQSHGRLYDKWTLPQAIHELKETRSPAISSLVRQFINVLRQSARDAMVATKAAQCASRESLFSASAIWAMAKSGSLSVLVSQLASRGGSRTSLARSYLGPSSESSSQRTIRPVHSENSRPSVEDHISSLSTSAALVDPPCASAGASQLRQRQNLDHSFRSRAFSTSMLVDCAESRKGSCLLIKGCSAVVGINPENDTCSFIRTIAVGNKRLRLSFSLTSDKAGRHCLGTSGLQLPRAYAIVTSVTLADVNQHVPRVDVTLMQPGEEVHIDQDASNAREGGFVLYLDAEALLIQFRGCNND